MIKLVAIITLLFSSQAYSNDDCNKIAKEFEQESYIYVICNDLAGISLKEARTTIDTIFAQRKGPPDETLVYFITSAEYIGQHQFPAEVLSIQVGRVGLRSASLHLPHTLSVIQIYESTSRYLLLKCNGSCYRAKK